MKRNIISGIILIGALALGSCSTTKLASNQADKDDDVYFSHAKAGDAPEYVYNNTNTQQQNTYNNNTDDDYYYYNSYASRINRFDYFSPFGYYDDFYDGYTSPYYGGYSPYASSFGLGFGFGGYGYSGFGGYGYSPFYSPFGYYSGFGIGYGYGYGYSPYSYFGTGYGNGGYWGVYSAATAVNTPRPYRGSGAPNTTNGGNGRGVRPIGYAGNYPVNTNYPGRPVVNNGSYGGRQAVNSTNSNNNNTNSRPIRNDQPTRQVYQPQPQTQSVPVTSSGNSNSSSGSSSGSSGSTSSGGGRPIRP